jgi:peptide/nickel transport system ATP-binding protein
LFFECKKIFISDGDNTLVDVSFKIDGKLGLVGKSGSGKSLILKTILGLSPSNLDFKFDYDSDFLYDIGKSISFVPQNPFTSLSPLTKIKNHFMIDLQKVEHIFGLLDLDLSFLDRYPSELSGGQLQRVVLAIALEHNPKLILLDEPTTALDFDTKNQILDVVNRLQQELDFLILFVSHDLDSIANICDRCIVLNNGLIVEDGKMIDIIDNPQEDYTKLLIESNFNNRGFRC